MTSHSTKSIHVPAITVLLPVRNSEKWLGQALKSLREQTFQDFEVLIIDDNSTDKTLQIASNSGIKAIRILQGPGEGIAAALALGVGSSESPYLARQDADDLSDPLRFQKQMEFLQLHPECAVVGTWAKVIDEEDRVSGVMKMPRDSNSIKLAMNFYSPFIHPSVILRRDAVVHSGNYRKGPSKVFSEDYDLWSRMMASTEFHNITEPLVSYRINSESITGSNGNLVNRSGSTISIRTTEATLGESLSDSDRRIFSLFYGRHRKISIVEALRLYSIMLRIVRKSKFSTIYSALGVKRWLLPIIWLFRRQKTSIPLWADDEAIQILK